MAFETAIYTDVTREEAVDGIDGFNFQSLSEGMDGKLQRQIREVMLHLVSNRWPAERDDLEHPPTAAYVPHEGVSYFSRGRSLGVTHSGRRGNQLTQAVASAEHEDLEPYLPAQIYAARTWQLDKAPAKQCAQWFTPLEINEDFETDALWQIFSDDPWVLEILPKYLTMLEQAAAEPTRKVVVVHDDLDTIMRWFALGTLLLDRERALSLGYRAFVTDVFQNSAQLIGVHPDLDHGSLAGAQTINLLERTCTETPISDSAERVAGWVRELDIYEALEVISIAQRWMPVLGTRLGAAGAEMVTGLKEGATSRADWQLSLQVIEGLARHGFVEDLTLYFDELSDVVTSYRLREEEDFVLSASATRFAEKSGFDGLVEVVLLPAMESLATVPEYAKLWAQEMDPEGVWTWPAVEDAVQLTELLTDIIVDAPSEALPYLLSLASRLSVPADSPRLLPALNDMAGLVLDDAGIDTDGIDGWFGAAQIKQFVRRRIVIGLSDPETAKAYQHALGVRDWNFLEPNADESMGPSAREDLATFRQWRAAVELSWLSNEQRVEALESGRLRPGANTWRLALAGTAAASHPDLYATWIRKVKASPELREEVLTLAQLTSVIEPKKAKTKDVERMIVLLDSLGSAPDEDGRIAQYGPELRELLANIPSFADKAKEKSEQIKGFFKRKNQEEEQL